MKKNAATIRIEFTREELFQAAFFVGYAVAKLQSDGAAALHDRAEKVLALLIAAEGDDEDAPGVVIDAPHHRSEE